MQAHKRNIIMQNFEYINDKRNEADSNNRAQKIKNSIPF